MAFDYNSSTELKVYSVLDYRLQITINVLIVSHFGQKRLLNALNVNVNSNWTSHLG